MKEEQKHFAAQIDALLDRMTFYLFENKRRYSFDYHLRAEFEAIRRAMEDDALKSDTPLSPALTNKLPIFLPSQTRRIAFFAYRSKSVRPVAIDRLEDLLRKQAKNRRLSPAQAEELIRQEMAIFRDYHAAHDFDGYRIDIASTTIQFNAYDDADHLLIEKSFVRGGLVFDLQPEAFDTQITLSYPRHRKQRSDKKSDYLPLTLIKIRGIHHKDQKGISPPNGSNGSSSS